MWRTQTRLKWFGNDVQSVKVQNQSSSSLAGIFLLLLLRWTTFASRNLISSKNTKWNLLTESTKFRFLMCSSACNHHKIESVSARTFPMPVNHPAALGEKMRPKKRIPACDKRKCISKCTRVVKYPNGIYGEIIKSSTLFEPPRVRCALIARSSGEKKAKLVYRAINIAAACLSLNCRKGLKKTHGRGRARFLGGVLLMVFYYHIIMRSHKRPFMGWQIFMVPARAF